MAKFMPHNYTRLRQIPNDPRLHVTTGGHTTSGYLAEASIEYTSSDIPTLHLELEESQYDVFSEGIDAARIDIPAHHLLSINVGGLRFDATTSYAWHQLEQALVTLKEWIRDGDPPPCGHEDVIETPCMSSATVTGVCLWCSTSLVQGEDGWVPA